MRKYLEELGLTSEDFYENWGKEDDRQEKWKVQRETYGFDERATWSLDTVIYQFLYERLRMYNEVNKVVTTFHKYDYKGEVLSIQGCIDRMIEGLEIVIKSKGVVEKDEDMEKINDIFPILNICKFDLWW